MKQNKSPIQYFNMALKYYENNIYDKAIYYFKKSIIAKPIDEFDFCDNIDTYIMIGMSFMSINDNSKENLENIVYYYTLALKNIHKINYIPKNKSSFKIIYDDLGIAYHMLNDIPNAVKYYEKSINFDDNVSVTTYKNLIYIYRHITNEIEKALHTALRFVHLNNQNAVLYNSADFIEFLIQNGADINTINNEGDSYIRIRW